jgi:hypothetical protein
MKTLIRWWYLLFRKKTCVKFIMRDCPYIYGDIIYICHNGDFKCLGKNWYYKLKEKQIL